MAINTAFRSPAQLTAVARAALEVADGEAYLSQFLPARDNLSLSYNFDVNAVNLAEAASFRAYDAEAPYTRAPGAASQSGKLPPASIKLPVSEYDELRLYNAGNEAVGAKLEEYATRLGAAIGARAEAARGEAIETGELTVDENGLSFTIDYGRDSGNTATAGTDWDAATGATPLDDLQTWIDTYTDANGSAPGVLLLSTKVLAALSKNTDTIEAIVGSSAAPSRVSYADVKSLLNGYGIGQTVVYDRKVNIGGVSTRVTSDSKVILLPASDGAPLLAGALGTTDFGVPAEAINTDYGIPVAERPGVFAGAFGRTDPEGLDVLASSIFLPVLSNANATFAATVLS